MPDPQPLKLPPPLTDDALDALAAVSPADVAAAVQFWDASTADVPVLSLDRPTRHFDARGLLEAETLEEHGV